MTVLFADLVGFTARAEQLDPEDVRGLLAPYHAHLREELERFGGTVEKFIGDAVVALFGAPTAHEDDPERAVRAALAIRDWVTQEGNELQLRVAVNTGEALIALGARPSEGEGMASGDVINTAARLQSAAPVNGILVGETTYRATNEVIDYREAEAVEAKGKSAPVPVWEALEARSRYGVDLGAGSCAALRARARARRAPRRARARPLAAPAPARHARRACRGSASRGSSTSSSDRSRPSPTSRPGARAARCPTAKASASGRWRRSSRPKRESSSPTRAGCREQAARGRREGGRRSERGRVDGGSAREPRRVAGRRRGGDCASERELLGLAAIPRVAGRPASTRPRLRRPALGRRRPARLHRPARGLGALRADPRALHGSARAAGAPAGLGWRQGERDHDLAAAAGGRGDGTALVGAARTSRPPGRDAIRPAGARGGEPAVCRAVRADARASAATPTTCLYRSRCRGSSPPASTGSRVPRSPCCRTHPSSARCSGSGWFARSAGSIASKGRRRCSGSSARSSPSARGARRSRARPSTRSVTSWCRDVAYGQIPRAARADKHRAAAEWVEAPRPARRPRGDARVALLARARVRPRDRSARTPSSSEQARTRCATPATARRHSRPGPLLPGSTRRRSSCGRRTTRSCRTCAFAAARARFNADGTGSI